MSYIQGYFEYIIRKKEAVTAYSEIRKDINKIENRITFRTDRILSKTFNIGNDEINPKH